MHILQRYVICVGTLLVIRVVNRIKYMIALLQRIFIGHFHKWEIIDNRNLIINEGGYSEARGSRFILQCTECGMVKKKDLV